MSESQDREDMKAALKEALKEWLDARFAEFGRYSFYALAAAGLAAAVYFILKADGYHK